jgi:hypothetical protein
MKPEATLLGFAELLVLLQGDDMFWQARVTIVCHYSAAYWLCCNLCIVICSNTVPCPPVSLIRGRLLSILQWLEYLRPQLILLANGVRQIDIRHP